MTNEPKGSRHKLGGVTISSRAKQFAAFARNRTLVGWRRAASSLIPALQMTVGAVTAFSIAEYGLGHTAPLFAATTAIISLGFSRDSRLRRVFEVAIGCLFGILIGEALIHVFGAGIWQAAVVLFVSIMLARFIDGSPLFTTQMGLQALLVVLLPAPDGGPLTRSLDAVVGGVIAVLITILAPRDPRREPQGNLKEVADELAGILRENSGALRSDDAKEAFHALTRARSCQPLIDSTQTSLRHAREIAQLSPAFWRHREELTSMGDSAEFLDLAVRSSRVVSRRVASVINHGAVSPQAREQLAEIFDLAAEATDSLGRALMEKTKSARKANAIMARNELSDAAVRLHPRELSVDGYEGEALVLLIRPMVVDLLQATGLSHEDAVQFLPRI